VAKDAPEERATSSPAVPGVPYDFAGPGSETPAELQARKLRRFWLTAFGWWLLAWLFAAGMWDLGHLGGLIAAVAIYCLIWWTLIKRLRFIPQLSAEAGRLFRMEYGFLRRVFAGYLLTGIVHVTMVLVTLALLNAVFCSWEMLHWPPAATTAYAFAFEHTSKEHRLLRTLNTFTDAMPTTELRLDGAVSAGWPGWTRVVIEVVFGLGCLQFPALAVLGWGGGRFSGEHYWRPWLAFLGTVTGSGLVVFWGIFFYSSPFLQISAAGAELRLQNREIRSSLNVAVVKATVSDCVLKPGYQPC
jgi:hypothetical protein